MNKHSDINTSYSLEHELAKSLDRMRENITRSHQIKKQITALRRQRRKAAEYPPDVVEWFKETEPYLEEGDEEEE